MKQQLFFVALLTLPRWLFRNQTTKSSVLLTTIKKGNWETSKFNYFKNYHNYEFTAGSIESIETEIVILIFCDIRAWTVCSAFSYKTFSKVRINLSFPWVSSSGNVSCTPSLSFLFKHFYLKQIQYGNLNYIKEVWEAGDRYFSKLKDDLRVTTNIYNNCRPGLLTADNCIGDKLVSYWRMCNYFLLPVAELDDCY